MGAEALNAGGGMTTKRVCPCICMRMYVFVCVCVCVSRAACRVLLRSFNAMVDGCRLLELWMETALWSCNATHP